MNLLFKSRPGANLLFGLPLFHVGGALTQALTMLSRLVERFKPETLTSVPTVLAAEPQKFFHGEAAAALSSCRPLDGVIPPASRIFGALPTAKGIADPPPATYCRLEWDCKG
jgi:hypothetical protein